MKPWVVDAKDIEPEDLDQFSGQLLHLNNQIADFLDPATTEEVLVIAPKGFGKTLLLKAKRQSMRERYRTMLPERALVDKPSANPDLMSHREYGSVRETEAYWKALWSIALTLAVEKHLGTCPELSGPLEKLVRNEHLRSACDLFTNLLALSRDAYFAAFKDYVAQLLPVFRRIHSSVAMFIDNIDEYFEDFLASDLIDTEEQRAIYRSYWHFAQVGIALAARDLHAINNHVKIFASIRKEVFQRTFLGNPLGLQLAGSALDLQYAREDLIEIIKKNIEVERKRSLVEPQARDPWVRFFGHARHQASCTRAPATRSTSARSGSATPSAGRATSCSSAATSRRSTRAGGRARPCASRSRAAPQRSRRASSPRCRRICRSSTARSCSG